MFATQMELGEPRSRSSARMWGTMPLAIRRFHGRFQRARHVDMIELTSSRGPRRIDRNRDRTGKHEDSFR